MSSERELLLVQLQEYVSKLDSKYDKLINEEYNSNILGTNKITKIISTNK